MTGTLPADKDGGPREPPSQSDLHERVIRWIGEDLANPSIGDRQRLWKIVQMLGRWRTSLIRDKLLEAYDGVVLGGPFAGLAGMHQVREGCHIPKLLGCYERELHPIVERITASSYDAVVNVGSAEGYYAIGLARRMPFARIYAHDTNADAQAACQALATRNEVADRVIVGGLFSPADFARFAAERTLVVCDIEGAEAELLDPAAAPSLLGMDMLVECHDCLRPGMSGLISTRFIQSHRIERVEQQMLPFDLPKEFRTVAELDRLLSIWEWRAGPTPWLFLTVRDDSPRMA